MRTALFILILLVMASPAIQGQSTQPAKKSPVFQFKTLRDTSQYKTPAYRQGVICNFEDQLSRKKVPLNFQLGNSKY